VCAAGLTGQRGGHGRRLWHQLTVALLAYVSGDAGERADAAELHALYTRFVADFAHRLNPFALAQLATAVAARQGTGPRASVCASCLTAWEGWLGQMPRRRGRYWRPW
jgi:hypothetical protein